MKRSRGLHAEIRGLQQAVGMQQVGSESEKLVGDDDEGLDKHSGKDRDPEEEVRK